MHVMQQVITRVADDPKTFMHLETQQSDGKCGPRLNLESSVRESENLCKFQLKGFSWWPYYMEGLWGVEEVMG